MGRNDNFCLRIVCFEFQFYSLVFLFVVVMMIILAGYEDWLMMIQGCVDVVCVRVFVNWQLSRDLLRNKCFFLFLIYQMSYFLVELWLLWKYLVELRSGR